MDLLKRSPSWDDCCSHLTLHQIGMVFLTTMWSNWFLFGSETIFDVLRHFEKSRDNIIKLDWLILLATRSGKGRKSRERADLANADKFNHRYLTCHISAILYDDRRKSQSLHRTQLAIFADLRDRRIKSLGVSPVLNFKGLLQIAVSKCIFWISCRIQMTMAVRMTGKHR